MRQWTLDKSMWWVHTSPFPVFKDGGQGADFS